MRELIFERDVVAPDVYERPARSVVAPTEALSRRHAPMAMDSILCAIVALLYYFESTGGMYDFSDDFKGECGAC